MARTEEQKLVQAPIIVVLGGQEYEIKPLVIKESRAWRAEVAKVIGLLPQMASFTTDHPDEFQAGIAAILVGMPDQVVDLVFSYAPELNREEIEEVATDAEIARAFEQISEVAFPLVRSMVGTMGKISQ